MKQWNHGYYVDSVYTFGYYPETMPVRLHWASLINDHITPTRQFRYLDAGCGQGFNLIMAAAAHPDSDFVGLDFLPEHIAHATRLARCCGLTNVRFIEADFVDLADDPAALGSFDYAICHGVSSWVAPEVKRGLYRLIGQVLKPGGVFYN
ncbi:MAG: class I SAM-dependent methyltransferase, partial [Methylococcaceae bacterium]